MGRYVRQTKLLGEAGQKKLKQSKVIVVGVGALGSHSAELLVRAGIGRIILIDDDVNELHNLQRQSLFNEEDVGRSKAESAASKLQKINKEVEIMSMIERFKKDSCHLLTDADLVLDCTDNMDTRYFLAECCKEIPWIHAAVAGHVGTVYAATADNAPFEKIFPKKKSKMNASTEGILNTTVAMASSLQVTEALKILTGEKASSELIRFNAWTGSIDKIKTK